MLSLTPFMTSLQDEVGKESVDRLLKKEKNINAFARCVDILDKPVPSSWPLSWTNSCAFSFEYDPPYSSFLAMSANNLSLHTLDLPYFPHDQEEICVHKGLFNDRFISNPHYFAETLIRTFFSLDVYIPHWYRNLITLPVQNRLNLKRERYRYWIKQTGILPKKIRRHAQWRISRNLPLWSLATVPRQVVVTPQPLSLLSYALEMFMADEVLFF